jgi:Crinkler effector protein N-terminal domain
MEDNPTRTIQLFCWILDVSKESFAVFIKESQTVFDLKQEILVMKRQRLPDVVRDTEDLAVWNVCGFSPL